MKIIKEAKQYFAEILAAAIFSLKARKPAQSPFDVPGVNTKATTSNILKAIKESRTRR